MGWHSVHLHRRLLLVALSLASLEVSAQSAPHATKAIKPPLAARSAADQELAALLSAQQQALQTQDPKKIAESTRPLAALLLAKLATIRLVQSRGLEAAELYRASLDLRDSSEIRLELASNLLRAGHAKEAAKEAEIVVQAQPQSASAWAVRGSALRSSGLEEEAVKALSRSLQLRSDVNTAYALASALLATHQEEKAGQIFQQIVRASKDAPIWHVAIGDAYREALYLSEAVREFQTAIRINPRVGHAEFFLGLTYLQMNQWGPSSQSFEHLRAAVRLAPRDFVSNFYLGALESTDGSDIASSDRHLRVAAEINPTSPEVWLYLGLNAVREKNLANAKIYLRKAVDLTGPNESRNNYQIRRVYAVLGRILINEGNHVEGDALLAKYKRTEQASLDNSANVIAQSANADLANSAMSGVETAKASFPGMSSASSRAQEPEATPSGPMTGQGVKQGTTETPQFIRAEQQLVMLLVNSLNDLGTAEARQGQYQLALGRFQQAERLQAPSPVLLRNLGAAAFRSGNFAESARALQLYLNAGSHDGGSVPQEDRSTMMLAMSLFSMGKFGDAEKAFATIPDFTLQDPRATYSWAYSLAHSGQQQRANQLADTLTKQEMPPDVMSLVCHIYMDTENYEQGIPCYRAAYQRDTNLKLAHYEVANALIRLDRPAEAVPELRQELVLNPENPDVQYLLAFALLQSSQKPEAATILEDLTATHPTHAQAQYQLGKLQLEQGATTSAISHLELAEQNDPSSDYIHYQLQSAYRKAGRTEDADRELSIYRDIKARNRDTAKAR